jgi:hypothetical protein
VILEKLNATNLKSSKEIISAAVTILCLLLVLTSCGKEKSGSTPMPLATNNDSIVSKLSQKGDWVVKERMTREGDVYYKEETLPLEMVNEAARKEYKSTQMGQVTVNPKFNTQLFRIEGKDTMNAVFVAPKIYSFSGSEVNRMQAVTNEDEGTMTLYFPIILIDGLSTTVPSPDSPHQSIKIPDNLLVKDIAGLNDFINNKYGSFGPQNLTRLSGCPKEIIMTIAGRQFNVAANILKLSDYCDYNNPITTSIKLPKKEALWLMQEGLYSGAAQITAIFETRVPYTVSKFSIEMNKAKLYEEIAARLKVNVPYAEIDLRADITKIVKRQGMKISIQGNLNEHLESIVRQAIDQFFEKMPADPSRADMSCGSAPVCLKLSYTNQTYEENLSVDWVQTSDVLSGQNITTWARLFPLSDANVRFENLKNFQDKLSTELVVMKDDLIELKITKKVIENFSESKQSGIKHNIVQVGNKTGKECSPYGHRVPIKLTPTKGSGDICRTTNTPIYEDQWFEETIFLAVKNSETIDNPIGKVETVTDDIYFGFSWNENGKIITKECPVNIFEREGDGRALLIRIRNIEGCEVFTKNSKNKPKLYLINKANTLKAKIKEGKIIKKWNGEVTDSTNDFFYQVNSSISGEISIRGYKVGNSDNSTSGSSLK